MDGGWHKPSARRAASHPLSGAYGFAKLLTDRASVPRAGCLAYTDGAVCFGLLEVLVKMLLLLPKTRLGSTVFLGTKIKIFLISYVPGLKRGEGHIHLHEKDVPLSVPVNFPLSLST